MGGETASDKDVKVSVRFAIEAFEISVETDSKQSETASTIATIIRSIQNKQEDIISAISGIDLTKFRPIKPRPELRDPLDKLVEKLGADINRLKKMFLIEGNNVYLACRREVFGERGGGQKAALALLYAYKYALEKSPAYDEFNASYQKMRFRPTSFGTQAKHSLLRVRKISESADGSLSIEPTAVLEAEQIIRNILSGL